MSNGTKRIAQAQFQQQQSCISPEIGELLFHYTVGLLSDDASDEVAEHLRSCQQCHDDHSSILTIERTARKKRGGRSGRRPSTSERVVKLADFKK
jgi:anti-sigma factor RsiW